MIYNKTEKRIDQLLSELKARVFSEVPLALAWQSAETQNGYGDDPAGPELDWEPVLSFPHAFGKEWTNYWFRARLDLPDLDGLYLELRAETEGMVYINGRPEAANNPHHPLIKLSRHAGSSISLAAEYWAGHKYPGYHPSMPSHLFTTVATQGKEDYPLFLQRPRVLRKNEEAYELYYDARVLRELTKVLPAASYQKALITSTLHTVLMRFDFDESSDDGIEREARRARAELKPLLDAKNGTIAPEILSVGNAHLDHAWLWPIDETVRKAARTALNMLNFAEEFEDFTFMFTQPAQMLAVRKRYPHVYAKVLEGYRNGKWEPSGTSWVEPDCMLPSGESLVRQFLYGLEASRSLYPGYRNETFWIPDSFGYNGNLPQILRGCGLNCFITSKIGWNDTNRFPYELFLWEGIDGTQIPAQMIVGAYEGTNEPVQIHQTYDKVQHKEIQPVLMRSIGEGDGGGGTTLEDLELMKRLHDLEGLPRNRWSTLDGAMKAIFTEEAVSNLPVYKGELYLELHRGTYTGQAEIKKANKELERELHNAEFLAACRFMAGKDVEEAQLLIRKAWETVLTNQFHDILPGSCINRAMEEARAAYDDARAKLSRAQALLEGEGEKKLYNLSPVTQKEDGMTFVPYSSGTSGKASSSAVLDGQAIRLCWGELVYDTALGGFSSVMLSDGRKLVPEGKVFGSLVLGPDTTVAWDAWDMEYDTIALRAPMAPDECAIEDTGGCVLIKLRYVTPTGKSWINQRVRISATAPRIDFSIESDWHEKHKLLRSEFPLTIDNDKAEFSIPFGHISRSTRENNDWDKAVFESPAQLYVHYSDALASVTISSASKYGYSVKNSTMGISLLKSASAPDPEADQGKHSFSYSVFFSKGGTEGLSAAVDAGYAVHNPPCLITESPDWKLPFDLVTLRGKVLLETLKISEDGSGVIARFYEALGSEAAISLKLNVMADVSETNLIEETVEEKPELEEITFHPFQLRTFLIRKR